LSQNLLFGLVFAQKVGHLPCKFTLLDVGQDWSIGYNHHDADTIHLYLEESLTSHVAEPAAVHALA